MATGIANAMEQPLEACTSRVEQALRKQPMQIPVYPLADLAFCPALPA